MANPVIQLPYWTYHWENIDRVRAHRRSMRLLRSTLNGRQRRQLKTNMSFNGPYFIVKGSHSGQRYRINISGWAATAINKRGRPIKNYCAKIFASPVPKGDEILAVKTMIELNEKRFLRIANAYSVAKWEI